MRRVLTIVVGLSLVVLGSGLTAQQGRGGGGGKPGLQPIPAVATYSDTAPDPLGGGGLVDSAIRIADYLGEIGELQFLSLGAGVIRFYCPSITPDVGLPAFPGCEDPLTDLTDAFTLTADVLRHMPLLTVSPNADCVDPADCDADGFGKQHDLEWQIGKQKYWLQFVRDAGTSPPNYVREECHQARTGATDTRCIEADMDTKVGIYDSTIDTGTMTGRETGTWARLWQGRKLVGLYSVPFSMSVVACEIEANVLCPSGGGE